MKTVMKSNVAVLKKLAFQRSQAGISLVELLIAIVLGLFLVWGVTQSFLTSRQSYRLQQGLGRIQENGRLAQEFLGFDIRNAGDYGCANGDDFITDTFDLRNDAACTASTGTVGVNMITAENFSNMFEYAVYGFNDVANTTAISDGTQSITLGRAAKAGTDVLVLRLAEELGVLTSKTWAAASRAEEDLSAYTFTINTEITTALPADEPLAISDCANMKVFAASAVAVVPTNTFQLSGANYCATAAFEQGASVRHLTTVYYFVAPSTTGTNFSLYRQIGDGGVADELLEGVDDIQLQFGVDTDADFLVDLWRTANAVLPEEWNGWDYDTVGATQEVNLVRAVRFSLLLRTADSVLSEDQGLTYNGVAQVYTDGLMRQVFTSSVGLRSRVK